MFGKFMSTMVGSRDAGVVTVEGINSLQGWSKRSKPDQQHQVP